MGKVCDYDRITPEDLLMRADADLASLAFE